MAVLFDLESNGLLDDVTEIHCLVTQDTETKEVRVFSSAPETYGTEPLESGVSFLMEAQAKGKQIGGHNVIKYDIPVLQKIYPHFQVNQDLVIDTIVLTRLIWTNIKDIDSGLLKKGKLPGKLFGSHKLEAWGYRLGVMKGEYQGGWKSLNADMLKYCIQDVAVTFALWEKIESKNYSSMAIELEHQVQWLIAQQERNGFRFDTNKAAVLYSELCQKRSDLERKLKEFFGSWVVQLPDFIPKRNNKTKGYIAGVPVKRSKVIEFNPSSRDHIADRLINLYGWTPTEFTEGGKPKVDEVVMAALSYEPCPLLLEYLLVQKRIGQLAEGDQAWLKLVKEGFIHGTVTTNGAVTGRATHSHPNVSQVPASDAPYGKACRELFTVPEGWILVGADASGLELRCLAHFMARWDGGKYAEVLLTGDIHSMNQQAAGLPTRSNAKTFIYAFLYGAGDAKIGAIVNGSAEEGRKLKARFLSKTPAIKKLKEAVTAAVKAKGNLKGLDGRILHVRSAHSALNTLLQSAGALICKKWLVLLEQSLKEEGLVHGWHGDYAFCAWSHDECQIACRNQEVADKVRLIAESCVAKAGEFFNFRCPLAGESKVGANWSETH